MSRVSGLDTRGAIRLQSYVRHCRWLLWAPLRATSTQSSEPRVHRAQHPDLLRWILLWQAPCKLWLGPLSSGSCWFLCELGVQDWAFKALLKLPGMVEAPLGDAPKQEPNLVIPKPLCKKPSLSPSLSLLILGDLREISHASMKFPQYPSLCILSYLNSSENPGLFLQTHA